jgi:dihydrofolate reductase
MQYTLIAAISKDGYLAHKDGSSIATSAEDKHFLSKQLSLHDIHLYGRKTYTDVRPKNSEHHVIYVLSRHVSSEKPAPTYVNFVATLDELFAPKQEAKKALILGGSSIYTYAIEHAIPSILYITVTSDSVGGGTPFVPQLDVLTKHYVLVQTSPLGSGEELRTYKKLTSS